MTSIRLLSGLLTGCFVPLTVWGFDIATPAYQLLNTRTTANRLAFYVYRDQDAGPNHGFPSGFFGNSPNFETAIHIDTGCVDDASQTTGCSSDTNKLDRTRGTVMRITFDPQAPSIFAGLNIEEPENWARSKGSGMGGKGYDLRGAVNLVLDIRSALATTVQLGVDGCTTAYFSVPVTWTTMTIPLSSLGNCSLDFSNFSAVHILFGIATNNARGGTFYLDNIRFDPAPFSQASVLGFPIGTQTFGVVPTQTSQSVPGDQVLRNVATVYESALAVLALLQRGTPQDIASAQEIADSFDYVLHHDSQGDPLPVAPNGSVGAHNAYENGDVALLNDQSGAKNGKAGDVRLAGFTATALCPQTGFCLVLDGATGGNNAFVILALVAAYGQFHDVRYLNDAMQIGNWIVANLQDKTGTGYGGYFLGYDDRGTLPPKPLLTGKSVENNADIFAAFQLLAAAQAQLGNTAAANSWRASANAAGDFVMQMFDSGAGRFNVGTVAAGASGNGICPNGPSRGSDIVNTCDFLDSNTFTTLAMATAPRYQNQIDWRLPVQYALDHFGQTVTASGQTFQGFDIVQMSVSGANGIAWEFTGQMVAAMRLVDGLYNDHRFQSSADLYLAQISNAQAQAPFTDGLGLVASTLQNGDTLHPIDQCLSTPFQCIPERVGLAATVWAIIAESQFNVFTSSTALFVDQVYLDVLNKQEDAPGFAYWTSQLSGGTSRIQVASGFFTSPEAQSTSGLVTNCYLGVFARDPDVAGWIYWIGSVRGGLTSQGLTTAFLNSSEGQAIYGGLDNTAFINMVYAKALNRVPDSSGFAYWLSQLNSRAVTPGGLLLAFITSPEFATLTKTHSTVIQLYQMLLRRQGDSGGVAWWTSQLNSGARLNSVIAGFLGSPEYRSRIN